MSTTMVTARRATGWDNEDNGNRRQPATKLTMMATARQATKSTTMLNARRVDEVDSNGECDNNNDNSATTVTTISKAQRATKSTMMVTAQRHRRQCQRRNEVVDNVDGAPGDDDDHNDYGATRCNNNDDVK